MGVTSVCGTGAVAAVSMDVVGRVSRDRVHRGVVRCRVCGYNPRRGRLRVLHGK